MTNERKDYLFDALLNHLSKLEDMEDFIHTLFAIGFQGDEIHDILEMNFSLSANEIDKKSGGFEDDPSLYEDEEDETQKEVASTPLERKFFDYMGQKVVLKKSFYINNKSLAVQLFAVDDNGEEEPYGVCTVNLENQCVQAEGNWQYVDTNNMPHIEDFLLENNIAEKLPFVGFSGFCQYPMYSFNVDLMEEMV